MLMKEMSVDQGDMCRWRRWVCMKEMIVGEGDECGWKIWMWGDLYKKWEIKIVSEEICHS